MPRCTNCKQQNPLLCEGCIREESIKVAGVIATVEPRLAIRDLVCEKKMDIMKLSGLLGELEMKVNCKLDHLKSRKEKLLLNQGVLDATAKRLAQKQQVLSVGEYLKNSESWDGKLPMLHPYRKLKSAVTSLQDERRSKCETFMSFFPATESLDLPSEDLTREVTFTFAAQILVAWSTYLDITLPFPIAIGSQSSSDLLQSDDTTPPIPRLLHPSLRRVALLDPRGGNRQSISLANKLFSEDLESLALMWGATRGGGDLMEFFARLVNAPVFGHPLALPTIRVQNSPDLKDERITLEDGNEWFILNNQ